MRRLPSKNNHKACENKNFKKNISFIWEVKKNFLSLQMFHIEVVLICIS